MMQLPTLRQRHLFYLWFQPEVTHCTLGTQELGFSPWQSEFTEEEFRRILCVGAEESWFEVEGVFFWLLTQMQHFCCNFYCGKGKILTRMKPFFCVGRGLN